MAEKTSDFIDSVLRSSKEDFESTIKKDTVPLTKKDLEALNKASMSSAEYRDILGYLKDTGTAYPSIRLDPQTEQSLYHPASNTIVLGLPAYEQAVNRKKPSTGVIHEMTHATQDPLTEQYAQATRWFADRPTDPEARRLFVQAYEKLRADKSELARKLDPKWEKSERAYRSSPVELEAFGVGNVQGNAVRRGPLHLDPTMATEAMILLDLARRDARRNPIKKEDGGEVSTEEFIKKNVPRGTSEVPQLDPEGRLIDEREDIRSESQRMLNRLQSQPSRVPPGIRRAVAASKAQGKESMFPAAAPARDLLSGILGASPTAPGSEAYRTGQAIANMPPVQAAAAIPAKVAASAGDAATALAAMGPAMAGAVRPYGKGTVFSGVKLSSGRDVQSSLDRYIDQGKSAAFSIGDVNTADAVQKFFDTKARRYMSTQLGTEKDPIFDAIKKGRISNLALHDMRNLRKYAIEAAGEGKYKVDKETGKPVMDAYGRPIFYPKDPRAVMDVTEGYDEMVDVRPMSLKPGLIPQSYYTSDPLYRAEVERINDQMRQAFEAEGLDPRLVNFVREPMILTSARDTGKPYYSGYLHNLDDFIQAKLSGDPEATKNVPENVRRALDQGEILYDVAVRPGPLQEILDPENMADYLATLSPKEIDKIRFEDAVVGSAKFNREKIDRKFEGQRIKELVESGKAPDSIFSKGVSEPLLQFDKDQRHPGFAWKRIEDLEATIPEGAYVGHSVGGYALGGAGYGPRYTKGFEEGTHEIYSLRNARNRPVTTIQVINHGSKDAPYRVVEQIKGNGAKTGNTAPVDYDEEVYDFLTQVVKPDAIQESDRYLTPLLIQYRDALEANRQTR